MYAIRYEIDGELTWWCRSFSDEELLYEIKACLDRNPTATVRVTLSV